MQGIEHGSAEGIAEASDASHEQEMLHDIAANLQDAHREQQRILSHLKEAVLGRDEELVHMKVHAWPSTSVSTHSG
jgi:hypothetical protein